MRTIGTVKWFNTSKGFGFITPDNAPKTNAGDVFVHYTGIGGDGFRNIDEGDRVEFDLRSGPKGQYAENVTVIEKAVATSRR